MTIYRLFEIVGGETGLKWHLPYSVCQKVKWFLLTRYYRKQSTKREKIHSAKKQPD